MSLLSFFANQRRRWFDQLADYTPEYFAGAWAALLQAEVAFRGTPLYNGHVQALRGEEALRSTEAQLYKVRTQLAQARAQLQKADPFILAAKRGEKDANRVAQKTRRQVALTQRALERMKAVAGADEFEPEVRLRYLQNMITSHIALLRDENPDGPPPAK